MCIRDRSTEALNIYDDGLHEKNISSTPFDGEGTPTQRLCLINKGRIENFIHSESTARIFKTMPTGHAGLGSKVSVSPDWIIVEKSEENSDLKTSLDHSTYQGEFVYIEELNAIHAGVRASQGSFSLPLLHINKVQLDFWYNSERHHHYLHKLFQRDRI